MTGCLDDDEICDFVAGLLSDEQTRALDRHIKDCSDCRSVVGEAAKAVFSNLNEANEATVLSSDTAFAPGVYVGRYEICRLIGSGGMGVVYSAYDSGLHRMVALKVMRGDMPQARLLREARAMARICHPNVVSLYDIGIFEGHVFIAMEYVDGVTLDRWIREEQRPWTETLRVLIAAAHGLAAAHDCGVVHGDFKPANVLVGHDGRVRVTDFGLAWWHPGSGDDRTTHIDGPPAALADSPAATQADSAGARVVGTVSYLAPEQLRGRGRDRRTDQFALCITLYECLYDHHPFAASTPSLLLARIRRGPPDPPPPNSPVPPFIFRVLARGLRVRPGERYATIDALISALTLREPTVRSSRRRRWLGLAARALALSAAGFAVGGGLAVLRARLRTDAPPARGAITRTNDLRAESQKQSASIERPRERSAE